MMPRSVFSGRAWKFGGNVDTDTIFPAWALAKVLSLDDFSVGAMAGADPDFHKKVTPGDFVVAEENFGCGSSRESAPLALLHAGISCVLAKSFARIFYRNCVNIGLVPVVCRAVGTIGTGDALELDLAKAVLVNRTRESRYRVRLPDGIAKDIVADGGLILHLRLRDWTF